MRFPILGDIWGTVFPVLVILGAILIIGISITKEVYPIKVDPVVERRFESAKKSNLMMRKDFIIYVLAHKIIECESKFKHVNNWGDLDYPYPAYGIAQFQERTFNWMKGLAKMPDLEWKNREDQIWLLRWALKNGYGNHWYTCYNRARR